jgi:uncharacterized protein YkwD
MTRPEDRCPLPFLRSPAVPARLALALALAMTAALAACDSATGAGPADVPGADVPEDAPYAEEVRGGGGTFPESATESQILALEQLNTARVASGLPPVNQVAALNQSSQAHAEFLVSNCSNYGTTGLSPHNEDASWPGFTGVQFWQRMTAAGYPDSSASEVIAFLNRPTLAVDGWIRTLYHRLPLLDPRTKEIGYGGATIPSDAPYCQYRQFWNADVIDIGMDSTADDVVVLYPPDGSKYIPTSFDGMESPMPTPPPAGWPSGTIITVQFGKDLPFTVTGHKLLGPGETELPHLIVAAKADDTAFVGADPNLHDDRVLSLYALSPLMTGNDYTVIVDMVRNGGPLHLEWTFKTDYVRD